MQIWFIFVISMLVAFLCHESSRVRKKNVTLKIQVILTSQVSRFRLDVATKENSGKIQAYSLVD